MGKNVKLLLIMHDDSVEELAKYLEITKSSLYNKIKNKTEFTVTEIRRLCTRYNVDANYLFKQEIEEN